MRTEDLIHRLSDAVEPVPVLQIPRLMMLGLGAGAIFSTLLMVASIGIRHDLLQAMGGSAFWMKFVYTSAVAVLSLKLVEELARPAPEAGRFVWLLAAPVLVMLAWAAFQFIPADSAERHALIMGSSARVCSILIASLALPLFASLFWTLRQLAPTRLREAGAAAGLLAGSAAATIYAFHCPESTPTFIAIWYTAGILLPALVGAALGRWLLHW
jgi:hypothetical protein